jgi:hypothetical protein
LAPGMGLGPRRPRCPALTRTRQRTGNIGTFDTAPPRALKLVRIIPKRFPSHASATAIDQARQTPRPLNTVRFRASCVSVPGRDRNDVRLLASTIALRGGLNGASGRSFSGSLPSVAVTMLMLKAGDPRATGAFDAARVLREAKE